MNLELDGRVALVSGCSQGLGYACVRTLARHGADIFGVSIGDDSALKKGGGGDGKIVSFPHRIAYDTRQHS